MRENVRYRYFPMVNYVDQRSSLNKCALRTDYNCLSVKLMSRGPPHRGRTYHNKCDLKSNKRWWVSEPYAEREPILIAGSCHQQT